MKLEDFVFPYGKLNPENEWVKLAELLPWDQIEERYAAKFENNGHPVHPCGWRDADYGRHLLFNLTKRLRELLRSFSYACRVWLFSIFAFLKPVVE